MPTGLTPDFEKPAFVKPHSIAFDGVVLQLVDAVARREGVSRSSAVRALLRRSIAEYLTGHEMSASQLIGSKSIATEPAQKVA